MCEWISKTFPWCVEHIGNASLAWQIAIGVLVLFFIVGAYICLYNVFCGIREYGIISRRKKRSRRVKHTSRANNFNFLSRYLSDNEAYVEDWMDADSWEETR